MKRFLFAFSVITGLLLGPAVQARSLDEIKSAGTLIVATEGAYPPFNYFQGSKLSGFEVELAEAMVKKMGLKIEWKALSFDALLAGLRQDRWDMVMASFGVTDERSKAVLFTSPYYCSGGVIVSKDAAIKDAATLTGKTVAVQTGSTYMENVKKLAGVKEVKNFPQDTDARSALVAGRVDAWVSDRFVVKTATESNPGLGLKTGDYLFVERIAAAVKKGNAPLAAAVDKALAEVMADGTYKTISEKFMKEDIRCKS
ncbi:ABC transporter substrate-binding protein [Actimicrobium sp. CCC2.4]|uniref:ABC transporter substrate-binding protein n=1 Tax=Actimicrobium sp. CCC2.4 TaxID=3048606 RepID=UPI002AC8E296|nr:ABC transporter substrate-binding protein [Actimicrobium sp. CCC2.4]MEB0136872.1 ABC transporter substrate-binding protein [Actimicrobium sp. CCC2.4]WPX33423.1 ABC transporter substrate-binding protein [Actimicrobium sp. CCC2.4]